MSQKSRPIADVVTGGWTPVPVYAQVNEPDPDDETYVTAPPDCGAFEVTLAPVGPPRTDRDAPAPALTVRLLGPGVVLVELLQGTNLVAARSYDPGPVFDDYVMTLTAAEAARIAYPAGVDPNPSLRVRVTAYGGSGSGGGDCAACLDRLCVTRDGSGCVTGVFYADDSGELHEVLSCGGGAVLDDPACVACLARLCVERGPGGCVTAVLYADDHGDLFEVPTCGSGSGGGGTLSCCPDRGSLPTRLYATFSGGTGTCACLDDVTVPLDWDGSAWVGATAACSISSATPVAFTTSCQAAFGGPCLITRTSVGTVLSCDPLLYEVTLTVSGCCSGVVTMTVTEVEP